MSEEVVIDGEAGALYIGALLDAANRRVPVNAARLAADALRAHRGSRASMQRLRAAVTARGSARPVARQRAASCRRARKGRRTRCKARGAPGRPGVGR